MPSPPPRAVTSTLPFALVTFVTLVACTPGSAKEPPPGTLAAAGADAAAMDASPQGGFDAGVDASTSVDDAAASDPTTCEEASRWKSYVGCDYWPTVVANNVWSVFDYAVVVANAGDVAADVQVTGPGGVSKTATVAPNALTKIFLPWVPALKGADFDQCAPVAMTGSVMAPKGAYHLVSSRPVSVYQFNALEYKGSGGPFGKSWAECPPSGYCKAGKLDCYSFSNDASLLLPSTAMTGNYRVSGVGGWTDGTGAGVNNSYFAITATQDGTTVKVKVGSKGLVLAGTGITATSPGETLTIALGAGDVAELACNASRDCDPSGSLVTADKPVQVITGVPCTQVPNNLGFCDHIEETVLPAETLGQHYVVTVPTAPRGSVVGHVVRFYGNVDGTKLTYAPTTPAGAPTTLDAGQVVEVPIPRDFEVRGDHSFAIASFMIGASNLDPSTMPPNQKGDPSQSVVIAVEQWREKYVFLTPDDYDWSFLDIVAPEGTKVLLDGADIATDRGEIANGFGSYRVRLDQDHQGAHTLSADRPIGLQVIGYGSYTSYYYPGGLNLKQISAPPIK